jgi:hypothetical protein
MGEIVAVIGGILGIITSGITIYTFVLERRQRNANVTGHSGQPRATATQPASPSSRPRTQQAFAEPSPLPSPKKSGFTLGRLASVFWGVIGLLCLQEGATFGEPLLMIIGIGFFYLAYIMWKK